MNSILILIATILAASDRGEADGLFAQGDFAGARSAYEALVAGEDEPAVKAALLERIGQCCLQEGDEWEAERWFTASLDSAETAAARLGRGRAYLYAGIRISQSPTAMGAEISSLMNDAAREVKRAVELAPELAEAQLVLGYVERYRQDSAAEAAAFRAALELSPGHAEAALQVAWLEERAGRGEQAQDILQQVPVAARSAEHWKGLGRLAAAVGDREAAAAGFREAVIAAPYDASCYVGLWEATGREKHFAEFNRDMVVTRQAFPESWLPDYYLGFSYRYDGKPEKAVEAFRLAQDKCGEGLKPLVLAADVLLMDLKREDDAIEVLLEILALEPANARAREVVSIVAYRRAQARELESAERLYLVLVEADPTNWTYATDLALILKETGRIEGAIAMYRDAADRFPFEPQILNDLGLLFMGQGRKVEGEEALRQALERDGEFLDSLENLGAFSRLEGRLAESLSYFRRAHARVLREGGDTKKFRRYLDMVSREIEDLESHPDRGGRGR